VARVVVTGGAGFIGSHVADAFLARSDDVLVVDDLSSGVRANVPEAAAFEHVDIVDAAALKQAFASFGPTLVCHLAAQASVTVSVERPAYDLGVNVLGTLNVLEAATPSGAPVVFASTGGALYGNDAPLPTDEDAQTHPLSPYGAAKLAGEAYVSTWARLHDAAHVILRLGNVYGPRQGAQGEAGVVAIFSERLLSGEPPPLRGNGEPTRDYVHVTDVARAFVVAADGGRAGTFNVGTGKQTSTAQVLGWLQAAAGTDVEPQQESLQPGELGVSVLDASRIGRELGWRPTIDVERGIRETFDWYKSSR
jgi:UDP-glucose 4-epimerase